VIYECRLVIDYNAFCFRFVLSFMHEDAFP